MELQVNLSQFRTDEVRSHLIGDDGLVNAIIAVMGGLFDGLQLGIDDSQEPVHRYLVLARSHHHFSVGLRPQLRNGLEDGGGIDFSIDSKIDTRSIWKQCTAC